MGIVRDASRKDEKVILTTLENVMDFEKEMDMKTMVIVGNATTFMFDRFMVTKRGYSDANLAINA